MLRRVAIAFKPSTFLGFHRAMVQCKYRLLFFTETETETGHKRPDRGEDPRGRRNEERNPTWGCPHIADQINLEFGTSINKDVVGYKNWIHAAWR
jgi:hypothetical protein